MSQDNIEKFIIQMGFADKEAVKGMREFFGKVKQHQTQANKQEKEKISLLRAQNALRKKINEAERVGLNTDFYKRSLNSAKKLQTVTMRTVELDKKIAQAKYANIQATKAEAAAQETLNRAKVRSRTNARLGSAVESYKDLMAGPRVGGGLFKASAEARKLRSDIEKAIQAKDVDQVRSLTRELSRLASQYQRVRKNTVGLHSAQQGLTDSTKHMIRSFLSMYAVMEGAKAINKTGQDFEAMQSAMLAAMGTQQAAGKEIAWLNNLTDRLGMSLLDTADNYNKFIFASKGKLPIEQTRMLFEGLSEMGTVLGISKERMNLSMMAIQQINGLPH